MLQEGCAFERTNSQFACQCVCSIGQFGLPKLEFSVLIGQVRICGPTQQLHVELASFTETCILGVPVWVSNNIKCYSECRSKGDIVIPCASFLMLSRCLRAYALRGILATQAYAFADASLATLCRRQVDEADGRWTYRPMGRHKPGGVLVPLFGGEGNAREITHFCGSPLGNKQTN